MNKPELVYVTYIRSTPQKVWDAITQPEFTRQYWGGNANVSDWKTGSEWKHVNKSNETWVTGKVVESIPPTRLVLSWADPDSLNDVSRVTFEMEPMEDEVRLTVTHDDFKVGSELRVLGRQQRVVLDREGEGRAHRVEGLTDGGELGEAEVVGRGCCRRRGRRR